MRNRKYIPKETNEKIFVKCGGCIHFNKCVNRTYTTNFCGSYKKKAGIKKRMKKRNR